MIPVYKPYLPKGSLQHAHNALDSTWISSKGEFLRRAEERLGDILGIEYIQLVSNGTCATHLMAKALKFKHPEIRKVYVPNNVYVAAWNSFLYDGEYEVVPIDADLETWNIDLARLEDLVAKDREVVAFCAVHNVGNIINVPEINKRLRGCIILEDNCEGLMGKYGSSFSGTKSLASSASFFGNKTLTSGEGGAIMTNDKELYDFVRRVQGQGQKRGETYIHDVLGYNYRMTNVQAAILLGQLEILPEILERKSEIFNNYRDGLESVEGVRLQHAECDTESADWMFAIRIVGNTGYKDIQAYLMSRGIDSRPMFCPMSRHAHLKGVAIKSEEVNAEVLSRECVMLPSFPTLTCSEVSHIVDSVVEYVGGLK